MGWFTKEVNRAAEDDAEEIFSDNSRQCEEINAQYMDNFRTLRNDIQTAIDTTDKHRLSLLGDIAALKKIADELSAFFKMWIGASFRTGNPDEMLALAVENSAEIVRAVSGQADTFTFSTLQEVSIDRFVQAVKAIRAYILQGKAPAWAENLMRILAQLHAVH